MDCEIIPTDPHTARKLVYVNTARAKQGRLGGDRSAVDGGGAGTGEEACDVNSSLCWR